MVLSWIALLRLRDVQVLIEDEESTRRCVVALPLSGVY